LAVTPDGARIVSGSLDNTVRVWNLATGRLERTLDGHADSVCAVAVTPDGTRIVSGSWDNTVRVWNLASGHLVACWIADPGILVQACCTVPADPSLVVYGDSAGGVHVLQVLKAQCVSREDAVRTGRGPTHDPRD
jgi:WD40 repeat protein